MSIESVTFKNALSKFASGVTVVTTRYAEEQQGITVSSFCSLSLTPPLVLICIYKKTFSHTLIEKSGVFAVNVLSEGQEEWGMRFAGMDPAVKDNDRFNQIECKTASTGSPILPNTLSWLDCKLYQSYPGGDHTIFVGEVVAASSEDDGHPLLYYNRNWRKLAILEE